jgi:hypothetical protein
MSGRRPAPADVYQVFGNRSGLPGFIKLLLEYRGRYLDHNLAFDQNEVWSVIFATGKR